jgi:Leucine-rich repeat (LRR) protein
MPSRLIVVFLWLLLAIPAVIFWLWLVILPARVEILCPEGCWCGPGGYEVDCSHSSLNNIPSIYLPHVQGLMLKNNSITYLANDSFTSRGLTELEEISFIDCKIEKIELGAFNGLTKLRVLSLLNNELFEIIPGTFEKMSSLEFLDLEGNRIEHLEVHVFSGLISLKDAFLGKNKLQHLHPDTFLRSPKLQNLYLADNPDLQIPTDLHFVNLHFLKHLDISRCNVSSVSAETFANVSALETIDLRYNNLRSVDVNILKALPKLSTLYLYDNPLQCDCQLQEVWRWCQDHNIQTAYWSRAPECDTPSEVQGMWWGVLEKGWCFQDKIQYYEGYKNTNYNYSPNERVNKYKSIILPLNQYEVQVYAAPFIFGTTSNAIILIIITCNKDMRTVPNMYILNLAISDMIYLTVLFLEACANTLTTKWIQGDCMCILFPFFRRLSVGLSAYSVAMLSIQRYRVTVNPLDILISSKPTWRSTGIAILVVWIVAAILSVPSALSKYSCNKYIVLEHLTYYQRVVIFELLVSCVSPLCVIAFSYIMTARSLVESSCRISEGTQNPQINTRKNTVKIVTALTFVFLISYVPYHAFWTYFVYTTRPYEAANKIVFEEEYKLEYMYLVSSCLLSINSCLNPVALFCTSHAFRRQYKRYLTCCFKANSTPTDLEPASTY